MHYTPQVNRDTGLGQKRVFMTVYLLASKYPEKEMVVEEFIHWYSIIPWVNWYNILHQTKVISYITCYYSPVSSITAL